MGSQGEAQMERYSGLMFSIPGILIFLIVGSSIFWGNKWGWWPNIKDWLIVMTFASIWGIGGIVDTSLTIREKITGK